MDGATDPDIIVAVLRGDLREVERLIASGADVNAREGLYLMKTPLIFAAERGNLKMVELLLAYGATVSLKDYHGREALMSAEGGAITARLLAAGADVDAVDELGETAFMRAVERHDVEKMLELHRAGANLNARDAGGDTALTRAIDHGFIAIRDTLKTLGATE